MKNRITTIEAASILIFCSVLCAEAHARGGVPRQRVSTLKAMLRHAVPPGATRAQRKQWGDVVRKAVRRAGRGAMRDLRTIIKHPSVSVHRDDPSNGAVRLRLLGLNHQAELSRGRLAVGHRHFSVQPANHYMPDGKRFSFTHKGVEVTRAEDKQKLKVDYKVNGLAFKDGGTVAVQHLVVKPDGAALDYSLKPGVRQMTSMLRDVGREMARLYPDARRLEIDRYRATMGYEGPKKRVKEYDLDLFRR